METKCKPDCTCRGCLELKMRTMKEIMMKALWDTIMKEISPYVKFTVSGVVYPWALLRNTEPKEVNSVVVWDHEASVFAEWRKEELIEKFNYHGIIKDLGDIVAIDKVFVLKASLPSPKP